MNGYLLLLFLAMGAFPVAHAGFGLLTPHEESVALEVFAKMCTGGSEGGEFAGSRIWCKLGQGDKEAEPINHSIVVPSQPLPDTVVYVQPAPISYKHSVILNAGDSTAGKTKIYVLPSKSTHSLTTKYTEGEVVTSKPSVYFLKSNGDENYRYGDALPSGVAGFA